LAFAWYVCVNGVLLRLGRCADRVVRPIGTNVVCVVIEYGQLIANGEDGPPALRYYWWVGCIIGDQVMERYYYWPNRCYCGCGLLLFVLLMINQTLVDRALCSFGTFLLCFVNNFIS
jgi:hypothetical protein